MKRKRRALDAAFIEENSIPEPNTGCWLWLKALSPIYAHTLVYHEVTGKRVHRGVHRVSWEIYNGRSVPANMFVLHRCDQPSCVNPDHLFLGTHTENMRDMASKGRGSRIVTKSILDESIVKEIRYGSLKSLRSSELAKKFGCSRPTISLLRNFRTWKDVLNA